MKLVRFKYYYYFQLKRNIHFRKIGFAFAFVSELHGFFSAVAYVLSSLSRHSLSFSSCFLFFFSAALLSFPQGSLLHTLTNRSQARQRGGAPPYSVVPCRNVVLFVKRKVTHS